MASAENNNSETKTIRYLLSVDGGGVRGRIAASFLCNLERKLGKPLFEVFDGFAGTSAGAMIVGQLASGMRAQNICDEVFSHDTLESIFDRTWTSYVPLFGKLSQKYNGEKKRDTIDRFLDPSTRLRDLDKKILVPTFNWTRRTPVLFHNFSSEGMPVARLNDVLDASSAAPYYFPPLPIYLSHPRFDIPSPLDDDDKGAEGQGYYDHLPRMSVPQSGDWYSDGGVSTNTPCITLYALARREWPDDDIRILSVGTGFEMVGEVDVGERGPRWGALDLLRGGVFGSLLSAPNQVNSLDSQLLMGGKHYLRVDGQLPDDVPADLDHLSIEHCRNLKNLGSAWYDTYEWKINQLFGEYFTITSSFK